MLHWRRLSDSALIMLSFFNSYIMRNPLSWSLILFFFSRSSSTLTLVLEYFILSDFNFYSDTCLCIYDLLNFSLITPISSSNILISIGRGNEGFFFTYFS